MFALVPVAPQPWPSPYVENAAGRNTPPRAQTVDGRGESGDGVLVVYSATPVEAPVVVGSESGHDSTDYDLLIMKSLAKFARPPKTEAIVGKMAQRARAEALNSAFSPHRRRKPKAQKVELDDPIYPWRGLWKFVGHTGYRDWLAARGVGPADIEKRISDEFNRTTTDIDFKDGELTVTVKTRSIGEVRRRKTVQKFPVDGETAVFLDSPSGPVSIVTLFHGTDLVMEIDTSAGLETHTRSFVDGLLHHRMVDSSGVECTLEFVRLD